MAPLIRKNFTVVLVLLALVFIATIITYYIWGTGYIFTQVNGATNGQLAVPANSSFDLAGAATIDYHGVLPARAPSSSL